jgi:hypothetical protein
MKQQSNEEINQLKEKLTSSENEIRTQQSHIDQLKLDHSKILNEAQDISNQLESKIKELTSEKVS